MTNGSQQDKNAGSNAAVSLSYLLVEAGAFVGVEYAIANLFANSRQACPVLVKLTARDVNNLPVRLPPRAVITLIPYIGANEKWTQSDQPSEFLPFPQGSFLPGAVQTEYVVGEDVTNDIELYNLYIYMPESMAQNQRVHVAVSVKLPGGAMYSTNNPDVPYGPTGELGRFNSSFYIQPFAPTSYSKANGMHIETMGFQDRFPADNRGAGVVHSYVTLTNPSTNRVVSAKASSSAISDVSATQHNKATGIIYPNENVCKHGVSSNQHYHELLNRNILSKGAITIVVGMIAYFGPEYYLPDSRHVTYSGWLDDYGNPFNITVALESIDPAIGNLPWQFTLTIDGN